MQEGDYTYQLTVTDTIGQQATAQVTVIVQPGKFQLEVQAVRLAGPFTLGEEEGLGSELKAGEWEAPIHRAPGSFCCPSNFCCSLP